ncbi:NuoM family protein [Neorickettsia risticii]|uniref:NADH-quinone oxidoreductase subunit M n=1 Tax=Neorickettsia risticii (strain Illinois) TaxID=434131 RepID=C6V5H6_NEORI|nr:NADH-quinone oxidoreductase subunit M [Neorickettsia risticii]ACT69644.1 NADH-quinone oxidoreductase chain m [Neorickettsia risticii str. Illinois]
MVQLVLVRCSRGVIPGQIMTPLFLALPLLASLLVPFFVSSSRYYLSVLFSASTFLASVIVAARAGSEFMVFQLGAITLKADELSCVMLLLTSLLTMLCVIMAKDKSPGYFGLLFLLEFVLAVFFLATDLLTFYITFELSLIPIFFIIGLWGGKKRVYAAFKIFLYTLFGSVGFLISILYLFAELGTLEISSLVYLVENTIPIAAQKLIWIAFFLAFAVKIPMFPLHTWLPDAHVQAPTEGSVMLAGVLIKLGTYGMLKVLLPIFPSLSREFSTLVLSLSAIAVIYTSLVALAQTDIKKLIAYSSIAHMGIVTAGLFAFNIEGYKGAVFQMVSHGLVSSGLFFCIGSIYDRSATRQIADHSGIMNFAPKLGFAFVLFSLAAIGLPGTAGFVGEFLALTGLFQSRETFAILCATGVVLGACYMLYLCKRIIWGTPEGKIFRDIHLHESIPLITLIILVMFLGLHPSLLLNFLR